MTYAMPVREAVARSRLDECLTRSRRDHFRPESVDDRWEADPGDVSSIAAKPCSLRSLSATCCLSLS